VGVGVGDPSVRKIPDCVDSCANRCAAVVIREYRMTVVGGGVEAARVRTLAAMRQSGRCGLRDAHAGRGRGGNGVAIVADPELGRVLPRLGMGAHEAPSTAMAAVGRHGALDYVVQSAGRAGE